MSPWPQGGRMFVTSDAVVRAPEAKPLSVARPDAIDSLTGLRFIAAICVAATHYVGHADYRVFGAQMDLTPLGMQLFFILSGFVIHYVYSKNFLLGTPYALRNFAAARFSRLYPLFIFFFVYFLLFRDMGHLIADPRVAWSYLTLTSTWWYWN